MAMVPAAKVGYLKSKKKFSQLSKDIFPLLSAMLLQIFMWFEEVVHRYGLAKYGLEVFLLGPLYLG